MENIENPVELVKDLADRIGIHQLYAIARDMRGETEADTAGDTVDMFDLEEIKEIADYLMTYYANHGEGRNDD